jgi:hypothetical protein
MKLEQRMHRPFLSPHAAGAYGTLWLSWPARMHKLCRTPHRQEWLSNWQNGYHVLQLIAKVSLRDVGPLLRLRGTV